MLAKRILTAALGIPAAVYIINYGQWLLALTIIALALVAWHEFASMMRHTQIKVWYPLGASCVLILLGCAWLGNVQEFIFILVVLLLWTLKQTVTSGLKFTITDAAFTILGTMYVGITFAHILMLRFSDTISITATPLGSLSTGAVYLWLAFIGTWASDTFAFFVGSKFGKNKLCPAISPGKTCEGAVGGLVGSILCVAAFGVYCNLPFIHAVIIGLLVGIAAPFGDLAESALKRFAGVKDSGRLLPGHGGVLDRFDSIMFAVPAVYYYLYAFVIK